MTSNSEPTPITYILTVLDLVSRSLKEGYVVATTANLAELTKNFRIVAQEVSEDKWQNEQDRAESAEHSSYAELNRSRQ